MAIGPSVAPAPHKMASLENAKEHTQPFNHVML